MAKNDYRDKKVLVIDNGLFTHVATKLSESFGTVYYWTPYVSAFPKSNSTLAGDGLDNIQRVLDYEDYENEVDLIVFPDVMFGAMQERMVKEGKRVFGARRGEELELDRWGTKKLLKSLGMPVAETHLIRGTSALRRFLEQRPGHWWIKTSRYRGDFETFSSEDYDDTKTVIDVREGELGMKSEIYPFIVERNIKAVLEIGYDGYTIDGKFPGDDDLCIFGCERKDLGYIGTAKKYGELPEPLRWVNSKLSEYLKKHQYRGLFSTEVRCTEENQFKDGPPKKFEDAPMIWNEGEQVPGTPFYGFLTDPCCRMASPPGELYIEWITNWDDIIWYGADGIFIIPKPAAKYGVEIMLHSSWADKNWQPVRFPEEIKQWVKLRNCCRINGVYCSVPQSVGLPEIGAVIGFGDTLMEASKLTLERAEEVNGYFIEAKTDAISKTIMELSNAQDEGIKFTDDPLPTPEQLKELIPAA